MGYKDDGLDEAAKCSQMVAQLERLAERPAAVAWRARLLRVSWRLWQSLDGRAKRALDIVVAGAALALTLPLLLLIALLIKLDSPGPVLFRQTRVGRLGRTFTCLKFRSMHVNAEAMLAELAEANEADGPVFKMRRDPRVTRVGRVIRKLSLDELPQLLNVLRGEMSLVGPRPALPQEVAQYTPVQARRLDAVPGITGLQQVSGRSNLDFERWVALDVQYIAEQSVWEDIKILILTIPTVLTGRGAY